MGAQYQFSCYIMERRCKIFQFIFLLVLTSTHQINCRPVPTPNLAVPITIALTPLGASLVSSAVAAAPGVLLGKALVGAGFLLGSSLGGALNDRESEQVNYSHSQKNKY